MSGDFRQTLPVISRGTKVDEVNACLKASYHWQHVTRFELNTNMRVLSSGPPGIFTETCNLSRHIQHSRQAGISTGPTRDPLSQSWWPHPVCNPGGRHRKNLPHVVPLSPPLSPRLTGRWEWGACKPCAILHPLGACMMCASAYGTPEPCLPLGSSQAGAVLVNSVAVLKGSER